MGSQIQSELCALGSNASASWCHEYCVEQFLHLWIPYLSVIQDLTDKVHGLLLDLCYRLWPFNSDDCVDHNVDSCHVQ
jgi:hypothetical protein